MLKKYEIWNKEDIIITPSGAVYTAEQWIAKHPVAGLDSIIVVCAAGEINGAYFGTLGSMIRRYEAEGCDFSACVTNEEKLAAIEAFDEAQEVAAAEAAAEAKTQEEAQITALASIAASMEFQNMLALDDVEVE